MNITVYDAARTCVALGDDGNAWFTTHNCRRYAIIFIDAFYVRLYLFDSWVNNDVASTLASEESEVHI